METVHIARQLATIALAAFCGCMPLSGSAQGIFDTPNLHPPDPRAGQQVSVELHGNACVLYLQPPDTPVLIARSGNEITLLVQAYVATDPILCNFPTGTVPFFIGAFDAGNYNVRVDAQYQEFFGDRITQTLGSLAFVVFAAAPVPALNNWGMLVLAILTATAMRFLDLKRPRTRPSGQAKNGFPLARE